MAAATPLHRRSLAVLACTLAVLAPASRAADEPKDFSAAERLLFMSPQLRGVTTPAVLRYAFRRSGTLDTGFDDTVSLAVAARPDGSCCSGQADFLSGARALPMPEMEGGEGNPVTMYFLEREVRDMQRLTKGAQNYFRKRIRMAIYESATVRDVSLAYKGGRIAGKEVVVAPYLNDPNRARYERFAGKRYQFLLSDAVPGGVYGIRARTDAPGGAGAAPLQVDEMWLEGAELPPLARGS